MIDKLLCLGNEDEAVGMLLESTAAMDSSDPTFYEYNLRAFLISACQQQKKEYSGKWLLRPNFKEITGITIIIPII